MKKLNKQTAIAHRTFEWMDNPNERVDIFIGKPYQVETGEWRCPYRIFGAGRDFNFTVCGADSMQALQFVFQIIDAVLVGDGLKLMLWGEPFGGFCGEMGLMVE